MRWWQRLEIYQSALRGFIARRRHSFGVRRTRVFHFHTMREQPLFFAIIPAHGDFVVLGFDYESSPERASRQARIAVPHPCSIVEEDWSRHPCA